MTLATRNPNRVLLKKQQDMVEQLRTGTLPTKPIPTIYQNDCLFNDSANQAGDRKAPSPGLRVNSQQNGNNEACEGFLPCSTRMGPTFGTHGSDLARRNPSELWCGQTTGIIEFSNAQRLHAKAMRNLNCKETEIARGRVLNMNKEVNEKLQRKISEASTLAHRLRQHSDALNAETERLAESRNHVASVLQNLVRPLRKCDRRKAVRTKRPERENIEDAVELAIQQERQELQHATQLLTEHISKTDRQIEVMRKVHSNMEQDIQDKLAAISVDKECLTLMKTSGETAVKMQTTAISASLSKSMPLPSGEAVASPRSKNMNNSGGNLAALMNLNTVKSNRLPTQWKDSSNIFIAQSKDLVNESLDLRTAGSSLCKRVKESQQSSCTFVEESLKKKLLVTSSLQSKLSKQRLQLGQELDRLMEQRDAVNQELSDISGPLEIVSRRLELRRTRPAREQVRDAVEEALETEYNSLKKTTQKLQLKLDKLNREIAAIQMSQKEVAADLEDKSRALELDQECLETASTSTSVSLPPMNRSNSSRSSTRSSRRRP